MNSPGVLRDLPTAQAAFTAYERLRRPRVETIAVRAAKINNVKAPGPLTSALMPLLMRLMMRLMMKTVMKPEKNSGPVQRYRIDWGIPADSGTVRVGS